MENSNKKSLAHNRFVIYILGFLFTIQAILPAYINSSFLTEFTGEKYLGWVYTLSALVTICLFTVTPHILERIGNYRTILSLSGIQLVSLLGLAYSGSAIAAIGFFVLNFASGALIGLNMDIFLENLSTENTVGKVRGTFLTSANIAWIIAPLLTGLILTDSQYWRVYIASALILLPVIALINSNLKGFKDPKYPELPFLQIVKNARADKSIFASFMMSFLLQLFFAWMVIYTPLHLHDHIGFTWEQIGVMFSIMLLPFILLELPLGRLEDSRWGEKEVLSIGFIIMAISTSMIPFIEAKSFLLWTTLLFITRIGASMVEISSETYFFKKIDGASLNFMSLYRTMRPLSYLVGPVLATAIFFVVPDFSYIFIILGLIMFYGLRWSLALEDTK